VHTVYTLRYARLYYGDPVGGISQHRREPAPGMTENAQQFGDPTDADSGAGGEDECR
jgi:hypothetical protein